MKISFPVPASLAVLTASALFALSPATAHAEKIYGLTASGQLFSFDSGTPGMTTAPVTITGVTAGQVLVGMDCRPATLGLYAFGYATATGAAQLYTIDPATAAATPVGSGIVIAAGVFTSSFGFDFDPVTDRIRLISRDRKNYQLNPDTGAIADTNTNLVFTLGDVNAASIPNVVALAYTNNFAGATTTTLFGYDFNLDALVRVGGPDEMPSPNTGAVDTIGDCGTESDAPPTIELDISGTTGIAYGNIDGGGSGTDQLFTFDLTTGQATNLGVIGTPGLQVMDIAVELVAPPTPTIAAAPAIKLKTPKKVTTAKAAYTIKGTGTDLASVEVKVGSAKIKKAKGTTNWSFKAQLKPGKNKVTVQAVSATGVKSAPLKFVITRE